MVSKILLVTNILTIPSPRPLLGSRPTLRSDPDGEYIRHWVPELRTVKGKAIHAPYERLSAEEFKKLGYPKPIVDHSEARQRALRRYKNPVSPIPTCDCEIL